MAFFNKKQEVLDIQLTPYGEDLLSRGKFKPTYYAFFDDDILYDGSGSAGIKETQNNIETRIQDETPKSKIQYVYNGPEKRTTARIQESWETIESTIGSATGPAGLESFLLSAESSGVDLDSYFYIDRSPPIFTDFSFVEPLGSMRIGSKHVPAWRIIALNGELTGAINYLTSSVESGGGGIHQNVRRIPQLDFDITYRVLVGDTSTFNMNSGIKDRIISDIFADGSFLYLAEDMPNLILAVDEENSPVGLEYDIEVFEVERSSVGEDTLLMPLSFQKEPDRIVNNILLDDDEVQRVPDVELNSSYAEYFFQVNADLEIPEEEICPKLANIKSRGFYFGNIPYVCPDVKDAGLVDVYGTDIGDVEECD